MHEFGYGFAGLADEYAYDGSDEYDTNVEPWEPNITTLVHFDTKWQDMLSRRTPIPTPVEKKYENCVGLYEGAGYSLKGVYRGMQDCRMRTNENPEFCPVCNRALQNLIKFYTDEE
jgi:hypothetical protein